MRHPLFFTWLSLLIGLAFGSAALADTTSSAVFVDVRSGTGADAKVVERYKLYGASHALIIGIDNYTKAWPKLSNAIKDAKLVAEALKGRGFEVELVTDPGGVELREALRRFFAIKGTNPDARLFVWFAGHGHTINGEGYLVPANAPSPGTPEFILSALHMRDVGAMVRIAQARHALVVFDACFSGTIFTTQRSRPPITITSAVTQPVRQFLSSGAADQQVSDDGTFRRLFIDALEGREPADLNQDGYLTGTELGFYLEDRITNLTEAAQTPRSGKLRDIRFDRGDFVFVSAASGDEATSLPRKSETGRESAADELAVELAFWGSIENSQRADDYLAYLEAYPQGRFAPLARSRAQAFAGSSSADPSEEAVDPGADTTGASTQQDSQQTAKLSPEASSQSKDAATLEAPSVIGAGAEIQIAWTGPDNKNDFVTIVTAGEEEGNYGAYAYTRKGSPLKVPAPDRPGSYELRYVTGQSRTTLAALPIDVSEVAATLEAPPAIGAGAEIRIAWTGPDNKGDFVTIVPEGEEDRKYGTYTYTSKGSPLKLRAPDKPGSYELRYLTGQSYSTLAALPIDVGEVAATLEAPPAIGAGAEIRIAWTGPDNKGDFVTIVPEGEEDRKYGTYTYTSKGSPLKLRAPDNPGSYELRYLTGQSYSTLAALPIDVSEVAATLEAPPEIGAGGEIRIAWSGPDNKGDFVTIVPEGEEDRKYGTYTYTSKGSPLKLRAPDKPGRYELRYLTGQSYATLAALPIDVSKVAATLEAPPEIGAGAEIQVAWSGPDNKGDFVTIVPAGEEDRKYGTYTYTSKGSPLKLRAPDKPGSYQLRYLTGQSRTTLAALPIDVSEVAASLEAPPEIGAGAEIRIAWTGPDNKGDFVTIVPAGEEEGKYGSYAYTRKGSPLEVQAPDQPGSYELRYLTGQSRRTLARLTIRVN